MELREFCSAVAATSTCTFAFSHETAAALWHLEAPPIERVEIVQTFRPCAGMAGDLVRHYRPDLSDAASRGASDYPSRLSNAPPSTAPSSVHRQQPWRSLTRPFAVSPMSPVSIARDRSPGRRWFANGCWLSSRNAAPSATHAVRERSSRSLTAWPSAGASPGCGGWHWPKDYHTPDFRFPSRSMARPSTEPTSGGRRRRSAPSRPIVAKYDGVEKYTDNAAEVVIDQTHREQPSGCVRRRVPALHQARPTPAQRSRTSAAPCLPGRDRAHHPTAAVPPPAPSPSRMGHRVR